METSSVEQKGIFCLGSFHITKHFMKAIGQHDTDSGLLDIWIESHVFVYNTASNNMSAKCYNQTTQAHQLSLNAVWRIFWSKFLTCAKMHGLSDQQFEILSTQLAESLSAGELDETFTVIQQLEETIQLKILCSAWMSMMKPTSHFWSHYMKMGDRQINIFFYVTLVC